MKARANAISPKSVGVSRRASAIIIARLSSLVTPALQHVQTTLQAAAPEMEPMDELESTDRTLAIRTPTDARKTNRGAEADSRHIRRQDAALAHLVIVSSCLLISSWVVAAQPLVAL